MIAKFLKNAVVVALALAGIVGAVAAVDWSARNSVLLWVEHWTGDWRTSLLADRKPTQHPDIALVTITEETLAPYPYRLPPDRKLIARLVTALDGMGVKAIGLDFLVARKTEPEKDRLLLEAIRAAKAPVIVAVGDARAQLLEREQAFQANFIAQSGALPGYANLLEADDRIVRFLAAPVANGPFPKSFAAQLAAPKAPPLREPRRIAWLLKPQDGSDTFIKVPAHLIAPPGVDGPSPMAAAFTNLLRGRIVIVGASLPDVDRHNTPLPDWEGEVQDGVFMQAQVVAQILDGRDILRVPRPYLLGIYAVLVMVGMVFGLRHGLAAMTLYGSTAMIAVAGIDLALFAITRLYLPFQACAIAMLLGLIGGAMLWRVLRYI